MKKIKKVWAKDGKWYLAPQHIACCDCQLSHKIEFRIVYKKKMPILYFRAFRDEIRTMQNRKKYGIK